MRAAVMRNVGDEGLDVVTDMETIPVGPGQVRIDIKATGVCHSDLSGLNGTIPQMTPAILGHEGAGVIAEVGDGVTNLAVGDHVIVAWAPPCGLCENCTGRHQPHLCMNIQMVMMGTPNFKQGDDIVWGFAGAGTWAESLVLPWQAAIKIADDVPFEVASLIGCAVTTGVGAVINTAKVKPGSNVVVFGAGGIGISVIQGARLAGAAQIVAVDLNKEKAEDAKRFGATHGCTPAELDAVKGEITGGEGFDYSFEAIGLSLTMRAAFDAIRRGGTCTIVGVGKMDDMLQFSAFEMFYSEKTLLSSFYGSADVRTDFNRLLNLWKAGRLDLEGMISKRLPLEDINGALTALEKGEVIRQVIEL
jgi:S-(hydroxymethyl)glutathione dehydrogenase/alcohol dehydrogenase